MNPTHGQVCAARTVLVKYSRWTQVVLATNWRHRENILCQTTWRSISVHRVISRPHDLALMLFVDKLSDGHFTGQTQSNSPDRICPITESIHGFQLDRCRLARCAMQLIFPSNHWRIYISANRLWEAKWVSAYRKAGVRRKKYWTPDCYSQKYHAGRLIADAGVKRRRSIEGSTEQKLSIFIGVRPVSRPTATEYCRAILSRL